MCRPQISPFLFVLDKAKRPAYAVGLLAKGKKEKNILWSFLLRNGYVIVFLILIGVELTRR